MRLQLGTTNRNHGSCIPGPEGYPDFAPSPQTQVESRQRELDPYLEVHEWACLGLLEGCPSHELVIALFVTTHELKGSSWVGHCSLAFWWLEDDGGLDPYSLPCMSHSLNSLKGGYIGNYIGDYYRGYEGAY